MPSKIVGRDAELEAVERFLDVAAHGNAALVVEGEPGIGKTAIWREAVERASLRGFFVLATRPAETEARLSYAGLADLLGQVYDDVRTQLPAPQQHALDLVLRRAVSERRADPRTTGMGFVEILRLLGASTTVVVALDDEQWLDRASQRALEFALRRLPARVGVIATRRSGREDLAPLALSRSVPDESLERLVLGPLSLAALHHLIRSRLGTSLPRPVLVRIASTSGGNPFYALEIARSLVREGAALAPGDRLHVPQSLQELVLARVSALSSQGREVLLVVSALSRPTVSTIAAVLDAPGVAAKAIIEAEEAGVILTDRTRIRFTHPLLASAVYASASQERMRRLHRRLADVVSDPEDRARHLAQGTIEGDETTAVEIEEAAERAARRGAPDAAAELYDAAVRLTPDDRHDDATRRGCGQAAALLAGGDPGGARAIAELALARASSATRRGEALFLLSEIAWVESPGRAPMDYLESALAEAGDDRRLRGRIHAKLAEFSLLDHPRVLEHADAAAALLSEDEDPGLLAAVLLNKVFFSAQVGQGAHHDLLERALRLEDRAGQDVERNRVGLIWFACMDELDAARTRYEFEDRWYRDRGEEGWRAERLGMLAWAEFNGGNWSTAEQAIEQSCTTLEQMGGPSGPWGMMFHFRAVIDAHRGRTERARETLRLLIEELEQTEHLFFAGISLSALGSVELTEDPEAANQMFQQMRRHFDSIGAVDPIGTRTEPDEVEALLALGEIESARAALDRLEWRGRLIPRPWISAALPRVRGLVHAAEDDTAAAIANFDALDLVAATRVPFEHARTLLVKGRLHRRLKQKRAAADALSESLALFRQLGAPLWEERAQAELGRVGLRRPATGELTASERRVAELAASGLTNREVAKAAFMSPKTVEANLARIYRKLGIKSRAELGAKIAGEARGHPTAKT